MKKRPSSYHERLKQRERTARELEQDKRKMNITTPLKAIAQKVDEQVQDVGDITQHLTGIRDGMVPEDKGQIPVDDGIPPLPPASVVATNLIHGLGIIWDPPPGGDLVDHSVVLITPQGSGAYEVRGLSHHADLSALDPIPHTVQVKLVDLFDRESIYSDPITATPTLTAAEAIDLSDLALNDRISGLLPNANLAAIGDPDKFVDGVIKGISLATGQNANVLPFSEAELENYGIDQIWPPVGVQTILGNGVTAIIRSISGRKWLEHTRSTTSTETWLYPFASLTERGTAGDSWYIYSAYVRNRGTSPVNVSVEVRDAASTSGPDVTYATSDPVTVPADGNEYRVWIRFQRDVTRPYVRFAHHLQNANTSCLWGRFQLEAVPEAKTEPGPYSVPAASFGSISAYLVGAYDLAAVNARFTDASIGNAKIQEILADKITTSSLTASTITLGSSFNPATGVTTRGKIAAGSTVFDELGVHLAPEADTGISPANNVSFKISPVVGVGESVWGAVSFYNSSIYRGVAIRSDGDIDGLPRGTLDFHATYAGTMVYTDTRACGLEINSNSTYGYAYLRGDFSVTRHMDVDGVLSVGNFASTGVTLFGGLNMGGATIDIGTNNAGGFPRTTINVWSDINMRGWSFIDASTSGDFSVNDALFVDDALDVSGDVDLGDNSPVTDIYLWGNTRINGNFYFSGNRVFIDGTDGTLWADI